MKITKVFAVAMFTLLFNSCNKTENKKGPVLDLKAIKEQATKDSIAKAELAEIDLAKEDSIKALDIKGYLVNKISGNHKYGRTIKVEYQSLSQVLDELRSTAKREMWTDHNLKSDLSFYRSIAKGGVVTLDINRGTRGAANSDNFSVIIKDIDEKEIFRKDFVKNRPTYSSKSDGWWTYCYASIDKRVSAPVYIYVIDKLADAPFKYKVMAVKK